MLLLGICLSGCFSRPKMWYVRVRDPMFPRTVAQFELMFTTEAACQRYLPECRWPDGFIGPRCGNRRADEIVKVRRWQVQ